MHWHNFITDLTWVSHIYWKSIIMDTCFYLLQYIAVLLIYILFLIQATEGAIVETRADFGQVFLFHNIARQTCWKSKTGSINLLKRHFCGISSDFGLWGIMAQMKWLKIKFLNVMNFLVVNNTKLYLIIIYNYQNITTESFKKVYLEMNS